MQNIELKRALSLHKASLFFQDSFELSSFKARLLIQFVQTA